MCEALRLIPVPQRRETGWERPQPPTLLSQGSGGVRQHVLTCPAGVLEHADVTPAVPYICDGICLPSRGPARAALALVGMGRPLGVAEQLRP